MKNKLISAGALVLAFGILTLQPAFAQKDTCAINQAKLTKAQAVVDRLGIRQDKLQATREKQEAKWQKGKEKKSSKTLSARSKNYARYSPDCFDATTPPSVTETPAHTEDASARCTGARNKEAKLFAKQTKNEESEFPEAKFDKKLARLVKKTEQAQAKVDQYQEYLDNNCSG